MREEMMMSEDNVLRKYCHDPESQAMFDHVCEEAARRGMMVNQDKTGLICFSAATSFDPRVVLYGANGSRIDS